LSTHTKLVDGIRFPPGRTGKLKNSICGLSNVVLGVMDVCDSIPTNVACDTEAAAWCRASGDGLFTKTVSTLKTAEEMGEGWFYVFGATEVFDFWLFVTCNSF